MPESIGTRLSACQARQAIYELADHYSWEVVAAELIGNLSGDEAREFVEDFQSLYAD
jgi:adenosine deaminase